MKNRTAEVVERLARVIQVGGLDARGALEVLHSAARQLREPQPVALVDVFRAIVVRARTRRTNHLMTPCCGQPIVPVQGHNAGRPCVMFNPHNEVVQCHRCGAVWEPLPPRS